MRVRPVSKNLWDSASISRENNFTSRFCIVASRQFILLVAGRGLGLWKDFIIFQNDLKFPSYLNWIENPKTKRLTCFKDTKGLCIKADDIFTMKTCRALSSRFTWPINLNYIKLVGIDWLSTRWFYFTFKQGHFLYLLYELEKGKFCVIINET